MPIFRKLGKMVSTDPHDALDRANRSGKVVADKTPVRVKKGTAIKKTPPKKSTSRWKGWVEITSECEEADQESIGAAHGAVFAEGKARAARSKEKLTGSRMLRGTSKLAARVMEETRLESKDEEMDEEGSTREADPQIPTIAVSKSIYPPEIAANPTTPAVGSQVLQSPPSALPDSSQDSIFAITLRHPSEVPSTLPASGAAMVIDTDEQGWTPIITSLAPDGSSSVDYWSYRTNTWCTIPRSAIRSTLPRLL